MASSINSLVVFAATETGLRALEVIKNQGYQIDCLVLDEKDSPEVFLEMRQMAITDKIILNGDLQQSIQNGSPLISPQAFDLGILAWWPYILKKETLALSRRGFLNFHPSLLPHNRGKNPNFWSIVEGTPFGVTIHWVNEKIDDGAIAFQKEIEKTWEDDGQSLHEKARTEIINLFRGNLDKIMSGEIPAIQQPKNTHVHYARELNAASRIELEQAYTGRELLNLLRARTFNGYPGCWFEDNGKRYEIRVEIQESK